MSHRNRIVILLVNGILALSLVILGILMWNHCPTEVSLARTIVGEFGYIYY